MRILSNVKYHEIDEIKQLIVEILFERSDLEKEAIEAFYFQTGGFEDFCEEIHHKMKQMIASGVWREKTTLLLEIFHFMLQKFDSELVLDFCLIQKVSGKKSEENGEENEEQTEQESKRRRTEESEQVLFEDSLYELVSFKDCFLCLLLSDCLSSPKEFECLLSMDLLGKLCMASSRACEEGCLEILVQQSFENRFSSVSSLGISYFWDTLCRHKSLGLVTSGESDVTCNFCDFLSTKGDRADITLYGMLNVILSANYKEETGEFVFRIIEKYFSLKASLTKKNKEDGKRMALIEDFFKKFSVNVDNQSTLVESFVFCLVSFVQKNLISFEAPPETKQNVSTIGKLKFLLSFIDKKQHRELLSLSSQSLESVLGIFVSMETIALFFYKK